MKKQVLIAFAVGLCLTVNIWAQVPSYVPTNGLVGYWPFNGNANDESGNGNNGTVNGASLTSDRFGTANNAYSFNSSSSNFIQFNTPANNNVTICGWYKCPTPNKYYPRLFYYGSSSSQNAPTTFLSAGIMGPEPSWLSNNFTGRFYNETNVSNSAVNQNLITSDNNWHHFVVSINSNAIITTYIDGQLAMTNSLNNTVNITNGQLFVGRDPIDNYGGATQGRFNGLIDDIGLFNRSLTQQEITDMYNSISCVYNLTISPSVNSLQIGNTANFMATTSDANASFTWQSDFGQGFQTLNNIGNYTGTTTNTLSISNVQLGNHNQAIRAISSNTNCIDTSNIATIQIADTCITNVTVYDTLLTTVTDTLIINTTLSLPAPNNENTILIYPNPASDHITIDNGNFAAMAGYSIKIENNAGQQVFQSAINQAQFYVDLSTWTGNGLYFVHLIDAQGNTVTVRKIVLQ
jgi:hypothetical protein